MLFSPGGSVCFTVTCSHTHTHKQSSQSCSNFSKQSSSLSFPFICAKGSCSHMCYNTPWSRKKILPHTCFTVPHICSFTHTHTHICTNLELHHQSQLFILQLFAHIILTDKASVKPVLLWTSSQLKSAQET